MESLTQPKGIFRNAEEITVDNLIDAILKRNPNLDSAEIKKAILFSMEAHCNQFRKSGMPYAEHPIEVAKQLAEYKMDTDTIIAGLLHDVVEDTDIPLRKLEKEFGSQVAFMVDAVTKISHITINNEVDKDRQKALTYRKFLLSIAQDPRVMMIKIMDRLHNMRTLNYIPSPAKRRRISQETMDIYAPLSHRFGLQKIKSELEDLSFKYINPDKYQEILKSVISHQKDRESYIFQLVKEIKKKFRNENLEVSVQGRPKNIHSIYQKLQMRDCTVEDIFDLFALRVIVTDKMSCYTALGHIHSLYSPLQSRFKDYIATPKANLYQSLHTTVIGPQSKMVEIQIRTKQMDITAERGFAAHWGYKEDSTDLGKSPILDEIPWLRQMIDVQDEISDAQEFLEFFQIDLKPQELVAFTPVGDSISLPHGATVLDFAYALHTKLGNNCIGARIEGQFYNPEKIIPYGASIQIVRSENQIPTQDWLKLVKTHKAKQAIKKYLRKSDQKKTQELGKLILTRELNQFGLTETLDAQIELLQDKLGLNSPQNLFLNIGDGKLKLEEIRHHIKKESHQSENTETIKVGIHSKHLTHFSECCNPVPGDPIIGVLNEGQGITIHREDCTLGREHLTQEPQQQIPVDWNPDEELAYEIRMEVIANDRPGLLDDITHTFSAFDISIVRASILTQNSRVRNNFRIKVHGLTQLEMAVQKLQSLPGVERAVRL